VTIVKGITPVLMACAAAGAPVVLIPQAAISRLTPRRRTGHFFERPTPGQTPTKMIVVRIEQVLLDCRSVHFARMAKLV
jgi:hypothetical protein